MIKQLNLQIKVLKKSSLLVRNGRQTVTTFLSSKNYWGNIKYYLMSSKLFIAEWANLLGNPAPIYLLVTRLISMAKLEVIFLTLYNSLIITGVDLRWSNTKHISYWKLGERIVLLLLTKSLKGLKLIPSLQIWATTNLQIFAINCNNIFPNFILILCSIRKK